MSIHQESSLDLSRADVRAANRLRSFQIAQKWASQNVGGLDRVVQELANHLPAAGVDVTCFVTGTTPELQAGGILRTFASTDAPTFERLRRARRVIGRAICQERPDLIASHFALYAWPLLDVIRSTPHVVHFHGPWAAECREDGGSRLASLPKRALEAQVYRSAHRVIVLSSAFQELIIKSFGVSPERVTVVPGSVDIQRFAIPQSRADARDMLGWPRDRPILVTVRRLVGRMGLESLIAAMTAIRQQVPGVVLFVCGSGRLRQTLEAQVHQANLQDHVRFTGFVPEEQLPLVYCAATLNVVPSSALEGFGLVAAEAMAAGTPSMVTAVGGLPEVVAGLSGSLVFPSRAVQDMADHLISALLGRLDIPSAERCRRYIAENFNSNLMAQRTAVVYQQALTESR